MVLVASESTMLELKIALEELNSTDGVALAVVISSCDVDRRTEVAAVV